MAALACAATSSDTGASERLVSTSWSILLLSIIMSLQRLIVSGMQAIMEGSSLTALPGLLISVSRSFFVGRLFSFGRTGAKSAADKSALRCRDYLSQSHLGPWWRHTELLKGRAGFD